MYKSVLIETKQYLVLIRFVILVSKLTFLDFVIFWDFFPKNMYLENGIFKICFRQSAKCKMTAQTGGNFMCFSKSAIYIVFYYQSFDFQAPTTFSLSLSDWFILQEVCFLYIQYISNISKISCTIDPIYPIDPIDSKNYVSWR